MALLGSLALEALQGLSRQPAGSAPAALPAELPLGLRANHHGRGKRIRGEGPAGSQGDDQRCQGGRADRRRRKAADSGQAGGRGADAEAREFVQAEMRRPFDVDGLPEAPDPQTAVAVYAASVLAIEVDTPAERDYLRRLAQGLGLEERTVQRLHAALGVA